MNARRGYENRTQSTGNVREDKGSDENRTKVFKQLIPQVPGEIPLNNVSMGEALFARFEDLDSPESEPVFYDCPVLSFIRFESVKELTHPNGRREELKSNYIDPFIWVDVPKKGVDAGARILSNVDPFAFDHERRGSGPLGLAFRGLVYKDGTPFVRKHIVK